MVPGVETRLIPIAAIVSGDHVQRFEVDEDKISDLKQSIGDLGLLSPIGVHPAGDKYRLVYGHDRLEACRRLGWSEITAVILWHDSDTEESVTFAENFFRSNLTAVELASAIAKEVERGKLTLQQIAHGFHREEDWVRRMVAMVSWPDEVLQAVHVGGLSAAAAANLAIIEEPEYRGFLVRQAVESGATARTTASWLQAWRMSMPAAAAILSPPAPGVGPSLPAIPQAPCFACGKVYRTDALSHVPICTECIPLVRRLGA